MCVSQVSKYLFRNDPQKFGEYLQQLGVWGSAVSSPIRGLGSNCYSNERKKICCLTLFGVRYQQIVELEL